jgi:hypothetical protein
MSKGFKKVNFYNYKEDGKFGITFKHNDQMYELQCTDDGGSFAFDFVPCIKVADNKYEWDYENPIFDNLISKGKIKKMGE